MRDPQIKKGPKRVKIQYFTLMLARMLRESSGPMVCDCGRSTSRRSPMVDSSTVRLVSVLGVRLMISICNTERERGGMRGEIGRQNPTTKKAEARSNKPRVTQCSLPKPSSTTIASPSEARVIKETDRSKM